MIMDHGTMQHFSMGPWPVVLACVTSFVGSLIGLSCAARAHRDRGHRVAMLWTAGGAVAIGGVAIWLMHFIAMYGFSITGTQVRYSVWLTVLSAVVSIGVVFVGLSQVTLRRFSGPRLLCAGAVAGVGVAFMHYLGMAAVRFQGDIGYDPLLVALSVVIAVVAATVAFWFTVVVRGTLARLGAGVVMAIAVSGMHYTGMAAVHVVVIPSRPAPVDADAFDLVFPVFLISGLVIAGLQWALFTSIGPGADRERAVRGGTVPGA
ncbi:NO-binding membrane sensor protein with MHYT domain [Kutzneria kofuensis]|uniref:NO-binding membrane sensor protein with MHYT domain n=2 Tax=Kutzneria kofuensis TaxID=103725 RepID=A0A7W9KDF6_9PSEU|nr:NO-binding membrane sensor protein with MHYT domain [Kutzneria kofuensis]